MTTTDMVWIIQFMWDGTGEWMRYVAAGKVDRVQAERVLLLMVAHQPNRKFRAVNLDTNEIIEQ